VQVLFGKQYRGFTRPKLDVLLQSLSSLVVQDLSANDPRPFCDGMICGNVAAIDSQAEHTRADIEMRGGICQVDPGLLFIGLVTGDTMMAAQGGYSLPQA
jgi:hypothetical protein